MSRWIEVKLYIGCTHGHGTVYYSTKQVVKLLEDARLAGTILPGAGSEGGTLPVEESAVVHLLWRDSDSSLEEWCGRINVFLEKLYAEMNQRWVRLICLIVEGTASWNRLIDLHLQSTRSISTTDLLPPQVVLLNPEGERDFLNQFRKFSTERPQSVYRDRCGLGPLSFPPADTGYDDQLISELTTQRGREVEQFINNGGTVRFILTRINLRDYDRSAHKPQQLAARFRALLERLNNFMSNDHVQAVRAPRSETFSEAILGDCLMLRAVKHADGRQFYKALERITDRFRITSAIEFFEEDFEQLRSGRSYKECKHEISDILQTNLESFRYSS